MRFADANVKVAAFLINNIIDGQGTVRINEKQIIGFSFDVAAVLIFNILDTREVSWSNLNVTSVRIVPCLDLLASSTDQF